MAEEFTLLLEVKGQENLIQLSGLVQALGAAGTTAERKLGDAARQSAAIKDGFKTLSTQFKSSFGELTNSVNTLSAALSSLQDKAARPKVGGKSSLVTTGEEAERTAKSVRELRAEIQKAYEESLVGVGPLGKGRSPDDGPDLRLLRSYGIQLTPEDQFRLKAMDAELAAREKYIQELQKQDKRIRDINVAHTRALEEDAKRTRTIGVAQAQAAEEDLKRTRSLGVAQAQAQEENTKRTRSLGIAQSKALEENADRNRQIALDWLADEDRLAKARQRIFEADQRYSKLAKQSSMDLRQYNMARGAKEALAQGQPLEQVEQRLGSMAVAAARNSEEFARLQTAAIEALTATSGSAAKAQGSIADLGAQVSKTERAFDRMSDRQKLNQAQLAAAMISGSGGRDRALRSFGPEIVELSQNKKEMEALQKRIKESGPPLRDHANAVHLAAAAYGSLHTGMRGVAGSMGAIWLTWGRPMAALWAGFASASVVKQATTLFVEYEHQLRMVQAVAEESAASVERLNKSILSQAKGGLFSAVELSQGARVLAQAGLDIPSVQTALPTVTRFSTVGEIPVPDAAQSLVGIASAFGQSTGNLSKTADVIGKAAAISQTSIEGMTAAMRVSSVVAEQYGASIEDVATILAVLAKRNIEGSAAGTAVRNAFTEIYAPSEKAKRALDALGISAYDAQTKQMKPFIQVMMEMRESVKNFNKESQNAIFQTLFGERGGKVASALLNDVKALEDAADKIQKSSGFVDNASLLIETSLKSRAVSALNEFKATLVSVGEASQGPMSQLISELSRIASSGELAQALKTLVSGFISFAAAVVKASEVLTYAFAAYFGSKALGGLAAFAGGLRGLVAQYGLLTVATQASTIAMRGQTVSLAAVTVGLEAAAAGAATSAVAMTGLSRAMGLITATLSTGIPWVIAIGTAVWAASEAWKAFKNNKQEALEGGSESYEEGFKRLQKRLDQEREKFRSLNDRVVMGNTNRNEADDYIEKLVNQVRREEEAEKATARLGEERAKTEDQRRRRAALYARVDADAAKRAEERIANIRKVGKELRIAISANDELGVIDAKRKMDNALKTGGKVFNPDDTSGRSYPSAIGTKQSAERAAAKDRFEAMKRDIDRIGKYIETYRKNQLIEEDQYNDAIQELAENRAIILIAEARRAYQDLDGQEAERRQDIIDRVKDPKERVKQFEALVEEFEMLRQRATLAIAEAEAESYRIADEAAMGSQFRLARREEELQRVINEANKRNDDRVADRQRSVTDLEEGFGASARLRVARDALNPVRALERQHQEDLIRLEESYAKKRAEARDAGDQTWLDNLEASEAAVKSSLQRVYDTLRQARSSEEVGLRASIIGMLDQVEDRATQVGNVLENAFSSAEDAFVDFVRTGKFSMKDLVSSIVADLARLSFQQAIKGPLLNSLLDALGGGGAPAASVATSVATGWFHAGGMVGSGGALGSADPSWFIGAQKRHSGGPVMKADEVPIIARKGETVLTPEQTRAMGGDAPVVVHNNVTVNGGASKADVLNAMEASRKSTILGIQDAQRRGRRRM